MNNVEIAMNHLIEVIKESEIYQEYVTQLERVKQQPDLKQQIDDFRERNYVLQTSGEAAFDKIEQFEREYEDFRENPYVSDFLAAELAFCRMMQDINIGITEAIHFE
ncbi:MAG: YlbF family regulator [Lachnospiraceae bacterium]|nr:YlbF family regulator [Lachnospiraceae bacterium]